MLAAVHLADIPLTRIPSVVRATRALSVPGLRRMDAGACAPLADGPPRPHPRRWTLFSFWDDEGDLDAFEAGHPLAEVFASGWSARLEPVRAHGSWPGLPSGIPAGRATEHSGRSVVTTLGWLRLSQLPRFLSASTPASAAAADHPGMEWGTAVARPPHFVATLSIWESTEALSRFAYGRKQPAHTDAIAAGDTKPFHHAEAFVRWRPISEAGTLDPDAKWKGGAG